LSKTTDQLGLLCSESSAFVVKICYSCSKTCSFAGRQQCAVVSIYKTNLIVFKIRSSCDWCEWICDVAVV